MRETDVYKLFTREEIRVDGLDFMGLYGANTDAVVDHKVGECRCRQQGLSAGREDPLQSLLLLSRTVRS